jgi:uncharacterized protein YodC (DUF2158 family)
VKQKYEIGDIVISKTGGPRMRIIYDKLGEDQEGYHYFNGRYRCAWIIDSKVQKDIFHQDALEIIKKRSE